MSESLRERYKAHADMTVKGDVFFTACDTLSRGIAQLAARVKALEARPALKYMGVFDAAAPYEAGHLVTKGGGMWIALKASTGATPGVSTDAWQLCVKGGRDGRDAR